MVREASVSRSEADWPLTNPWPFLAAGFGAAVLAWILSAIAGMPVFLRVLLIFFGLLAAGGGVTIRPKSGRVLAAAAAVALVSGWAMDADWDSARLLMGVLTGVALVAAFLVALPRLMGQTFRGWEFMFCGHRKPNFDKAEKSGRWFGWVLSRALVSVLVVLHFLGIVSSFMSVPPRDRPASWLFFVVNQYYQPYLQFMYLTNAYRFYSPDPGPPSLLWFRVEYTDGSSRWVKIPSREQDSKDPLGQEFTRRLSIGNSADRAMVIPPLTEDVKRRRILARIPNNPDGVNGVPRHPEGALEMQYRHPEEMSKRYISQYARHVAQAYPHDDPNIDVAGVKVYLVIHNMLLPPQLVNPKFKPDDAWTYMPFYDGDFDKDGKLKDPDDPLLYWLIPRFLWPVGKPLKNPLAPPMPDDGYQEGQEHRLVDLLEAHGQMKTTERGPNR